jgi:hypothetical protein
MNQATTVFVTLFSMLGLVFIAFFVFKWWLNNDIRVILNALYIARGTNIAMDDDEAQLSYANIYRQRHG